MNHEIKWQRLLHVGGTKEYRVFWFRNTATGAAHTVKMWGKVGRLTGNGIERDDASTKFNKTASDKEGRGYELDGSMSQVSPVLKTDAWIEHERGEAAAFGLPGAFLLYERAMTRGLPGVTLEHSDGSSEIVTLDHDPMPSTPPKRKPAAPTPPDYSLNPNFGIF